ncbi:meiotically up-regulated 65 protein [Sarocladium implicatum]|nr:meiotically up-regulated 65 protein [Sarocladium implicatum]
MLKVKNARRALTLRPKDYDHEIDLVDHDRAASPPQQIHQPEDTDGDTGGDTADVSRASTNAELLHHRHDSNVTDEDFATPLDEPRSLSAQPTNDNQDDLPHEALRPEISVQAASPAIYRGDVPNVMKKRPHVERETVIDILYENERGGFLCGTALFSGAALGGLDAAPWTNAYHNPSPTSIHTATVPDPSWEWVWPEWRINHQDEMDDGGWEYSFAYSKKFSWHGPKWWNSFVRRRAWIRKRARKPDEDVPSNMHMLTTDYFLIQPASTRNQHGSLASSGDPSKAPSMSQESSVSGEPVQLPEIQDMDTLMRILKKTRIDREKLEAVKNYLENGLDQEQLATQMHDIMGIFIFQASRRLLLSHLMQIYDSTTEELEKAKEEGESGLQRRQEALKKAVKHADEEVRRLAYWSDVKQMAENGESKGAVDGDKGWDDETWEGIDQSGPGEPNKGKLPAD